MTPSRSDVTGRFSCETTSLSRSCTGRDCELAPTMSFEVFGQPGLSGAPPGGLPRNQLKSAMKDGSFTATAGIPTKSKSGVRRTKNDAESTQGLSQVKVRAGTYVQRKLDSFSLRSKELQRDLEDRPIAFETAKIAPDDGASLDEARSGVPSDPFDARQYSSDKLAVEESFSHDEVGQEPRQRSFLSSFTRHTATMKAGIRRKSDYFHAQFSDTMGSFDRSEHSERSDRSDDDQKLPYPFPVRGFGPRGRRSEPWIGSMRPRSDAEYRSGVSLSMMNVTGRGRAGKLGQDHVTGEIGYECSKLKSLIESERAKRIASTQEFESVKVS